MLVASSEAKLARGDLWDSGRVESDAMSNVAYDGAALASGQSCCWKVRVWDEKGEEKSSETAWFEMGLLSEEDWKLPWMGVDGRSGGPALYFRKEMSSSRRRWGGRGSTSRGWATTS